MPELPEVQAMVNNLRQEVVGCRIVDLWVGAPKIIKNLSVLVFSRLIKNKRIEEIDRRGKNIIFYFDNCSAVLVHPKLTGHFLIGSRKDFSLPSIRQNKFYLFKQKPNYRVYLIFYLDNGSVFGLSDSRKFAKVVFYRQRNDLEKDLDKKIGPDALKIKFKDFSSRLAVRRGRIKTVLMDQKIVSGIGNIYADEILYAAKIHPLLTAASLSEVQRYDIYQSMRKILKTSIKFYNAFTDLTGARGQKELFSKKRFVYGRMNKSCFCGRAFIQRIKINGRSSYFCPVEQKLKPNQISIK